MEDSRTPRSNYLLIAGKLLLGLGLVALVAVLISGLRTTPTPTVSVQDPANAQHSFVEQPAATPLEQAAAMGGYLVARTMVDTIAVREAPSSQAKVVSEFLRKDEFNMPTTFLVLEESDGDDGSDWYHVRVSMRPNGTTGWVKASDVQPRILTRSVRISLSNHNLELYQKGSLIKTYPVALGTAENPTPTGEFFFTTKFIPTNESGVYGAFAIGISAYSENLTDWPGEAQVGIHGTNRPELIGQNVSHGCIRMRNEDILELTEVTPLGTPVVIVD